MTELCGKMELLLNKKKKWYEASSDEEEAKQEIKIRNPSEIRNSQLRHVFKMTLIETPKTISNCRWRPRDLPSF